MIQVDPVIAKELEDLVQGKDHNAAATTLSLHRTGLSEHRTSLSEHRTALSEKRTALSNIRSHLSNERTHLSYLRTSISLMTFGTTLNRFSVYLMQSNLLPLGKAPLRDTERAGVGMLIIGIALLTWSLFRYRRVYHDILNQRFYHPSPLPTLLTALITILAAAGALWMILG